LLGIFLELRRPQINRVFDFVGSSWLGRFVGVRWLCGRQHQGTLRHCVQVEGSDFSSSNNSSQQSEWPTRSEEPHRDKRQEGLETRASHAPIGRMFHCPTMSIERQRDSQHHCQTMSIERQRDSQHHTPPGRSDQIGMQVDLNGSELCAASPREIAGSRVGVTSMDPPIETRIDLTVSVHDCRYR